MRCSFTRTGAVSRKPAARESNTARKSRRQRIAAAAEAALQTEGESSNAAVVQATDTERPQDSNRGLNLDSGDQEQAISSNDAVQPDDLHGLEDQQSEQRPAALEAGKEVNSFLLFQSVVTRLCILTYESLM